ncbi:MAG: ABC transporter ATP-binding protein [Chloroflexi bacterium]|nr:MAG: ABC transporter ATP-binding protein [Chloroflexota bacterium]
MGMAMASAPILPVAPNGLAVEAHGLTKRYGQTVALDGLELQVQSGHVFGLLGPNGAGKTTAVKVLLGLTHADGGSGRLLGEPIERAAARQRVGYLPELFRYPGWLKAREVLGLHLRLGGIPRDRWGGEIDTALLNADLQGRAESRVATFSKGMQQRLGLAVALIGTPALVILDEPTTALDPIGRLELREIIRGLRDAGTTVLLNSHQLSEVEQVCDQVAIIHRGRLQASGTLDELLTPGGVRIRATGIPDEIMARLREHHEVISDGPWLRIAGAVEEAIPGMVAAIVQGGGQVYGVELLHPSLEERFRQLVAGPPADGRPAEDGSS